MYPKRAWVGEVFTSFSGREGSGGAIIIVVENKSRMKRQHIRRTEITMYWSEMYLRMFVSSVTKVGKSIPAWNRSNFYH